MLHSPEMLEKLKCLLDCREISITAKKSGGNSVVICATTEKGKWAVKSYPPYAPDQRDRLTAEVMTYQFLNQQQIFSVPQLKMYSKVERWLILSWLEGEQPTDYSSDDINQALDFIRKIANLNVLPEALSLPIAAEACLSLDTVINQINHRLQRLSRLPEASLLDFLHHEFRPVFAVCQEQAFAGYAAHDIDPQKLLPQCKRSLIPADFGLHNTIQDKNGQLYFFDFDYFGWDDPVKLLADILWHPKMQLSKSQQQLFIQGLSAIYAADVDFLPRFQYTQALFGLRWTLILLNEFIPEVWLNRQHAKSHLDQQTAKENQLKRAKELLGTVKQSGCLRWPL